MNMDYKNTAQLLEKVKVLDKLVLSNPALNRISNLNTSLLGAEIFSTLYTEGDVSSRKLASKVVKKKNYSGNDEGVQSLVDNYSFIVTNKPKFTISNFFTIYNLMHEAIGDEKNALEDGVMFRSDVGIINKAKIGIEETTMDPSNIKAEMTKLCVYLNNSDDNITLKAIKGHIWFLAIHPYYDLNGRTSRYIPFWVTILAGDVSKLLFFATAMNNFRGSYIAAFNKYIDREKGVYNIDRIADKLLDLLILNQRQYKWLKDLESTFMDTTKKAFNEVQKWFIWTLMIKRENQGDNKESWNKITKQDREFIEKTEKDSNFTTYVNALVNVGIVDKTSTKPVQYKLKNYSIFRY